MNINENKEIENAEPTYILLNTKFSEYTQTYTETVLEFEYDEDISIYQRTVTVYALNGTTKDEISFWLGYLNSTRLFYLAYPKTLSQAFESIRNDYAWFRSQLTDTYQSETLRKK